MIISISDAVQATEIFSIIFFLVLVIFVRRREDTAWIPLSLSTELKGLAILMIVFSHIGYFLVNDHRFLWPLSSLAGVGVDLFLLLSGYGLAVSQLQKNLTIKQFYQRRLIKLFIPFWLVLIVLLVLDFLVLKINYSWDYIGWAFLGIFTRADLYQDINSPLWYFTFILIYYLAFPLLFSKTRPWLSAAIMYLIGYLLIWWNPVQLANAVHLYRVHIVAFPLGVFIAWLMSKIKNPEFLEKLTPGWRTFFYYFSLAGLLGIFVYANTHSGIGLSANLEQVMSIVAVLVLLGIFILKKIEFKLFYWFGVYSYEIYLLHWPLMYRYDIFYSWLPAWLATLLYLVFFIGLGWIATKLTNLITERSAAKPRLSN